MEVNKQGYYRCIDMKNSLIALSYASCWGVGLTLSKIALAEISPTTLLMIQLISSVLFLFVVCYFKEGKIPVSLKNLKLGKAGIFEPGLAYMFGTVGLEMTTATNASLIASSEVIMTIVAAAFFLREKLTTRKAILALASFSGVFLLLSQDSQSVANNSLIGDALVLLGTTFAVGYVLISKSQVNNASAINLTASQQFVGLIVTVIGFGILSVVNQKYEINAFNIPVQFWLLAIVSGIMQYALAFLLYITALNDLNVSSSAFYVALVPVFSVASAILLIGEQPNALQWIGAVLVLTSSYFANKLRTA